jgi:protein-S-isoprenylcysteine O-methyltransferase Ste14
VTREHATGDAAARSFAIAGGLIFVWSLVYAAWSYGWTFGLTMSGSTSPVGPASLDALLFTGFALHHSVFARTGAREWMADRVSPRLERSVYVWVASLLLLIIVAGWQPVPGELWRVTGLQELAFNAVQIAGVLVTLRASAALDVLSLAGVRQAFGTSAAGPAHLVDSGLYGVVRHPVYFGWVLMVWPTPAMTGTRLVFAAVSTIYLALAIPLEERSLRTQFGAAYRDYAAKVRWRMVPGIY